MTIESFNFEAEKIWLSQSLTAYSKSREPHLRDEIAIRTSWLSKRSAQRFRERGEPFDDLFQVANIGLLKAIDRFKPDQGVHFTMYATPTIIGELRRYFRDNTWCVHVPRPTKDLQAVINSAREYLESYLIRPPHPFEIARHLDISVDSVIHVLEANNAHRSYPLDHAKQDHFKTADIDFDNVLDHEIISNMLSLLPVRQRKIIYLHFFEELSQEQIARVMSMSQVHVGRLISISLEQLRHDWDTSTLQVSS
jgi:RNA polymerase sigma-B factor